MATMLSPTAPGDSEAASAFLEGLFRHSPTPVAFFDRHLGCIRANAALAARNGRPASDHAGLSVSGVIPSEGDAVARAVAEVLETGNAVRVRVSDEAIDCYPVRDGGETIGVGLVVTPARQDEDDDFFALVAHDLRSPLNVIAGWTRMLQGGGLTPEARARALETIERSVARQAQLIDDLENGSHTRVAGRTQDKITHDKHGKRGSARAGTARSR